MSSCGQRPEQRAPCRVLLVANLGPEFPAPWGTGAPPVDESRWQPGPGRKGGDLNKGRPLCKEHDNSQVAKSRRLPCSILVSLAGVRGLAPARWPQLFWPLSCGSSHFGVFWVRLTGSEGEAVAICSHVLG